MWCPVNPEQPLHKDPVQSTVGAAVDVTDVNLVQDMFSW